jgi:repressor LexA
MENKNNHYANNLIYKLKKFYNLKSDTDLSLKLGVSNVTISNWRARDTINLKLIIEKVKGADLNWLLSNAEYSQNENILNEVNETPANYLVNKQGIPMIPYEAVAGVGSGEFTIQESEVESRYFVPEFSRADYLIRVKGSSMYPKYSSGDVLACKKMDKSKFIQWNKTYVLDTSQGILIKRIIKGASSHQWILRSDNKDYQDIEVNPNDDVNHISLVMGVIRLE